MCDEDCRMGFTGGLTEESFSTYSEVVDRFSPDDSGRAGGGGGFKPWLDSNIPVFGGGGGADLVGGAGAAFLNAGGDWEAGASRDGTGGGGLGEAVDLKFWAPNGVLLLPVLLLPNELLFPNTARGNWGEGGLNGAGGGGCLRVSGGLVLAGGAGGREIDMAELVDFSFGIPPANNPPNWGADDSTGAGPDDPGGLRIGGGDLAALPPFGAAF